MASVPLPLALLGPEMMPKTTPKIASNTNRRPSRMVTEGDFVEQGARRRYRRSSGWCILQVDKVLNDAAGRDGILRRI